jgi:hemolysin activation/secretion protein
LWLAFNNYQSPTIGEERGIATLEHQNLTGHGDILSFTYGYSEGLEPLIDAWYAIPVNAYDTTLQFRYRQSDQTVVDDVFGPLDIESEEKSYELSLRHPVYRTLTQEFALSLSVEKETCENHLLGDRFSFSPGEDNGRSTVAPLRFGQEWTYRTQRQVIAARSRFTFGLDAFGATTHSDSDIPDGKFFAWLGQVQYARILDFWNIQLLARADIQRANDPLLPIEQMGIGGRYSVRGYRENLLVTDQAFIASLETRIPLVENMRWADYLHFCQFVDYGKGDNVELSTPSPSEISSVGVGLRWGAALVKLPFELRSDAEVYWGYQLRDVDDLDEGPQDDGIHYQIAITGYF